MNNATSTMAQQIAEAANAFEQRRTGHAPKTVTVVHRERTLVITLHGALTPAEIVMSRSPAGAAQVQEFHRQLFATSSEPLRQEIERITGIQVAEAGAEVVSAAGAVTQALTTGTVVQVFLLAHELAADVWNKGRAANQS